ncbi:MAG: TRAP transporter small permease [Amphritea sp.]
MNTKTTHLEADLDIIPDTHPDAHLDHYIGPEAVKLVPDKEQTDVSLFFRLERKFIALIRGLLVFVSIALGLLMFSQVVMRYGIESPFLGIEELAPMLALWIYFLGMTHATREREHITGGIVTLIFSNHRVIDAIRIFGTVVCLILTVVFGYFAYKYALFNFELGRKSLYLRWPKSLWDFSMFTGFLLVGFYYVLQLIAEVRDFKNIKSTKS